MISSLESSVCKTSDKAGNFPISLPGPSQSEKHLSEFFNRLAKRWGTKW